MRISILALALIVPALAEAKADEATYAVTVELTDV
jgi:hypothetical protein